MSSKKLLAGVSLAALGAAGLSMLSTPAFATGVVNWYLVGQGGGNSSPTYSCEGTPCPTPGSVHVSPGAPEYAEQAINSGGPTLTIPGYGSGSPYGGFTWFDSNYTGTGGNAFLTFTMPAGEVLKSVGGSTCPGNVAPANLGGVDGTSFLNVVSLSCSATQIQAVISVATLGTATGGAYYQLPSFQLQVNAALIAALGSPTANGGSASTEGGNCESPTISNGPGCEITAATTQLASVTGGGSQILATSQNVVSLRTFNNSQLICIDVLEDQQPGTRFQQPCLGNISISNTPGGNKNLYVNDPSQVNSGQGNGGELSPTKVDGNVNGTPENGNVIDPACTDISVSYATSGPATGECGNGSVTGTLGSSSDLLVADKGTIEIDVTELLALDGIHLYQWLGGSRQSPTLTIVGLCAGLEGPIENIGSTACAGGLKPFTGETANGGYVGLTPLTFTTPAAVNLLAGLSPFNPSSTTPAGASAFCPKEDDLHGSVSTLIPGNGSTATFSGLSLAEITNNTKLVNAGYVDHPTYYEFCDYADGQTILGPVAQWYVTVSVDAGQLDATILTDNPKGLSSIGASSAVIANPSQAADALLVYEFNGVGQLFQFTNGAGNFSAWLRVVNLMEDYSVTTPAACVNLDPNLTCEPAGAVVCKVWGDDGQNAFVTAWSSQGTADGQLTGTNAMISVQGLFTLAGITASNANPFDLGAMLCFHNARIHLSQFWIEPSGSIVNIE